MIYLPVCKKALGEVRAYLQREGFITSKPSLRHGIHAVSPQAPYVFVACSGGRDSLALMWAVSILGGMYQFNTGAIIVDHHLQRGSSEVAAQAAHTCTKMGVNKVLIEDIDIPIEQQKKQGVEAAARQKRYDALIKVSRSYNNAPILLAHTMDDVAETVILGFLRGLSPRSLVGIAPTTWRENILLGRPFLNISRQETTQICENNDIVWWDDPTNGDDIHSCTETADKGDFPLRSQIRHRVLPLLEEMAGRKVKNHLVSISQQEREDNEYLDCVSWDLYQKYAQYQVKDTHKGEDVGREDKKENKKIQKYEEIKENKGVEENKRIEESKGVEENKEIEESEKRRENEKDKESEAESSYREISFSRKDIIKSPTSLLRRIFRYAIFIISNEEIYTKMRIQQRDTKAYTQNESGENAHTNTDSDSDITARYVDSRACVSEIKMIYALDKALSLFFQEKGSGEVIISQNMRIVRQHGEIRFIYSEGRPLANNA